MRIGVITDIHCGPQADSGPDVRDVVAAFVKRANEARVDLLLDLGDRIDDVDRTTDLAVTAELAEIFRAFPGPRVHLRGNHDVVNLTDEDHLRLFGQLPGNRVVECDGVRVVVWEPSVQFSRSSGFPVVGENLDWLTMTLAGDERPAIIVSHIPVSGAAMTGNYYFANNADFATYPDHAAIREAVEATGRAALWLSGHVHWNSVTTTGNIWHLTVQSPSEKFTTMPDAAASFALLDIGNGAARLEVFGLDPLAITMPFAPSATHPWPRPRARVSRTTQ